VLKKFLNKQSGNQSPIFPHVNQNHTAIPNASEIIEALLVNQQFLNNLVDAVSNRVLDSLVLRYEFEPTDKYKEDAANKKKYLSQLDSYLQERKEINLVVEGELNNFLQQTTAHLTKALENFSTSIQNRIRVAETKHGIDIIKQSILAVSSKEQREGN